METAGKFGFNVASYEPLQRARIEDGVVAVLGDPVFRPLVERHGHSAVGQWLVEPASLARPR